MKISFATNLGLFKFMAAVLSGCCLQMRMAAAMQATWLRTLLTLLLSASGE